jgi:hypothetical protein
MSANAIFPVVVQRLETRGGVFSGECQAVGSLHLEPYSADYVFLK